MNNDLISRNSVIELLKKWSDGYSYIELPTEDAILQITTLPTAERPQVVLFAENMTEEEKQKLIAEFKAVMDNAKFTIEPERPKGEWVSLSNGTWVNCGRKCSICGKVVEFSENYCPNCGADMRPNESAD